jgi:hypothetical protein
MSETAQEESLRRNVRVLRIALLVATLIAVVFAAISIASQTWLMLLLEIVVLVICAVAYWLTFAMLKAARPQ